MQNENSIKEEGLVIEETIENLMLINDESINNYWTLEQPMMIEENLEEKCLLIDKFFDSIANENNKIMESGAETKVEPVLEIGPPQIEVQPDHEPNNKLSENKRIKFVNWNMVSHLQLWHNKNDDAVIHFPWANSSCALDSTLSALWIIYLRMQSNIERLNLFREEFPKVVEVFDHLYAGEIHNIQAKERFIKLFKIKDKRYKINSSVELRLITDYLKSNLSAVHPNGEESLLEWAYKSYWLCATCGAKTCQKYTYGPEKGEDFIHRRDNVLFMISSSTFTVQESIESILSESTLVRVCEKCMIPCTILRESLSHPIILHLSYPYGGEGVVVDVPTFIEEVIIVEGVVYDLVGVVYGDGLHFFLRFLKDSKVYEADGMQCHSTSSYTKKVRAALSRELPGCHKQSLAGHIDCEINDEKVILAGKKVVDIYYLKREI